MKRWKNILLPVLLCVAMAGGTGRQGGRKPAGTTIENFDAGNISLVSYPGEDIQPNGWALDSLVTPTGSGKSLKLTGNTWKVKQISPLPVDSATIWSVAARVSDVGEAQGFGVMDSLHTLLFAFMGSEQLATDLWVTVDQGALSAGAWHQYILHIADEWLTRYGYLPRLTGLVFVNDRDSDPSAVINFDDVIDISADRPHPPSVTITYSQGAEFLDAAGKRSVDLQFYSHVVDPDSGTFVYAWQFGDNTASDSANPHHIFVVEDDHEYTVTLEVQDQTGLRGRSAVHIGVDRGATSYPIHLNFTGDIMLARRYEQPGGIIPTQGVNAIFAPTVPYLGAAADLTVVNFECSLTTSTTAHPTKSIVFKSSPANVTGLVYAGVDVVSNANNHIIDYGIAGLQETQTVLRQHGIRYSGAGANAEEACRPLFVSRSGVSFAFLAFSDRTGQYNNWQPYLNASDNKPGFANFTLYELERQINRVQGVANRIVLELHSGIEYSTAPDAPVEEEYPPFSPALLNPTETDRSIRRAAIDAGVDLLINHHSHIAQGFEVYRGKLIAHSLGNFVFELPYSETYPSLILNAEVNEHGFSSFSVTPVYIDHYIPRRATGEFGTHILDYLTMRSRDLGTYLIVHPDSVKATIVLDTTTLWPRVRDGQRTVLLTRSGSYSVSKPIQLPRQGSIAGIPSLLPQGTWQYRLGREVVWFGNCENEGGNLFAFDVSDEQFDSTVAHGGHRSVKHRRAAGAGTLSTSLEMRVTPSTTAPAFSIHGWIKTDNAKEATLRGKLYNSRTGTEVATGDIGTLVGGTTDWSFFSGDITAPSGVTFVDVFMESKAPASGTGYAWFDDVGMIEWTDWITYDGTGATAYPNDIYWLQVRTPSVIDNATVTFREAGFLDLAQPTSVVANVGQGWNLISNPVERADSMRHVRSLYPSSTFEYAFDFSAGTGYHQSYTLEQGKGYWERFGSPTSVEIAGSPVVRDTIDVEAGWNLIGTLSYPVDTAAIVSIPAGLLSSDYFGYSQGYVPADVLTPGSGYWVKANAAGRLVLEGSVRASLLARNPRIDEGSINFFDAGGERCRLSLPGTCGRSIELPPPPPPGGIDVRYAGTGLSSGEGRECELPLCIASDHYPIRISWSDLNGDTQAKVEVGGVIRNLVGSGDVQVPAAGVTVSILYTPKGDMPATFALEQNYPNPFNPVTSIRYAIPTRVPVRLQIFNITGQLVRTVVSDVQNAGRHTAQWYGENDAGISVGSGVYFCRLVAGGYVRAIKVLLMK
jgi:poly-gamma-glutamate capsule biosynthesis protein CapA/YwtB (metallophosphatase superfamily)